MSQLGRALLAAATAIATTAIPGRAAATDIEHKRQEAAQIATELEHLQNRAFELGGQFDEAEQDLAEVTADVSRAQGELEVLESRVATLQASAKKLALHAYVTGIQQDGLAFLVGGQTPGEALPRDQYISLALGVQVRTVDQLGAVSEDAARQRDLLKTRQAEQERLRAALADRQDEVESALGRYRRLQAQVQGELAELVAVEQARQARLIQQQALRSAGHTTAAAPSTRTGRTRGSNSASPVRSIGGPRAGANVPPPSPGAGGAVAAALSQVGVPYRFAAASPGEAFDCSGLTMWAWARAGVTLPHQSRAQAGMLPQVHQAQAQPGDLIFYYSPIGHVAMYIGGGQLVHATRPGDVVKVAVVRWDRVAVIGRPG